MYCIAVEIFTDVVLQLQGAFGNIEQRKRKLFLKFYFYLFVQQQQLITTTT